MVRFVSYPAEGALPYPPEIYTLPKDHPDWDEPLFYEREMNNPISPFEKWRLETIPQVGFTPEIRELLAMAFEGGRQSVLKEKNHDD